MPLRRKKRIKLLVESGGDGIHHAADAGEDVSMFFAGHPELMRLNVERQLEGGGQIVIHEFRISAQFIRVLFT